MNEEGVNIHLFPNPSHEEVYLQYELPKDEMISISLVNMQGQKTILWRGNARAGKNAMTFSLEEMASGIYEMEVLGKEINTKSKLVIMK